jgi:hypothetical protein
VSCFCCTICLANRTAAETGRIETTVLNLNKNAAGATCGVREHKKRLLIFWQQARFEEPLVIKSADTDAQENFVSSFVSHSGGIITQRLFLLKVTIFW